MVDNYKGTWTGTPASSTSAGPTVTTVINPSITIAIPGTTPYVAVPGGPTTTTTNWGTGGYGAGGMGGTSGGGTGTAIVTGTGYGSTGTTPAGPGTVVSSTTNYVSPTQAYWGVLPGQYLQHKTETYDIGRGSTQTREYYRDPASGNWRVMPDRGPGAAPGSMTSFKSVSTDLFESTYSPMPQGQTTMEPKITETKIVDTSIIPTQTAPVYDTRETFFEPKYGFYASPEWKSMRAASDKIGADIAGRWETMPYEEKLARTGIQTMAFGIVGGPLLMGPSTLAKVGQAGVQLGYGAGLAYETSQRGPGVLLEPETLGTAPLFFVKPIAKTSPVHYADTNLGWKGLYTYGERPLVGKTSEGLTLGMPKPEITASAITELQSAGPSKGYTPTTKIETKMVARPEVFEKMGVPATEFEKVQIGQRFIDYTKNIEVPGKVLSDAKFTRDIGSMGPAGVEASLATSKANIKDVEMHYGSHMAEAQLTSEFKAQIGKPGDIDKMLKPTTAEGAAAFAGKELGAIQAAGETARISPKSPTLIEVKGALGTKDWVHAVDIHYPGEPSLDIGSVPGKGSYGVPYGKPPIRVEGIPGMKLSEQVHKKIGDTSLGIWPGTKTEKIKLNIVDIEKDTGFLSPAVGDIGADIFVSKSTSPLEQVKVIRHEVTHSLDPLVKKMENVEFVPQNKLKINRALKDVDLVYGKGTSEKTIKEVYEKDEWLTEARAYLSETPEKLPLTTTGREVKGFMKDYSVTKPGLFKEGNIVIVKSVGKGRVGPPEHRMKDVTQGLLAVRQLKAYRESTLGSKLDPREGGKSRQIAKDIVRWQELWPEADWGKQGPLENIPYTAPARGRGEPSFAAFPTASMANFKRPSGSNYLPSKSSYLPSGPNYLPSKASGYLPSRSTMPSRMPRSPSIRPSVSLGPSTYPSSRPPSKPPSGYTTYSPKPSPSPYPSLIPRSLSPSPSLGMGSMIAGRKRLRMDFGLPSFGKEKDVWGGYGLKMTPRYSPTAVGNVFNIRESVNTGKTWTGLEPYRPIASKRRSSKRRSKVRGKRKKGLFDISDDFF